MSLPKFIERKLRTRGVSEGTRPSTSATPPAPHRRRIRAVHALTVQTGAGAPARGATSRSPLPSVITLIRTKRRQTMPKDRTLKVQDKAPIRSLAAGSALPR